MKFKGLLCGVIFGCSFLLLGFSTQDQQVTKPAQTGKQVEFDYTQSLARDILKLNSALGEFFKAKRFDDMASLLDVRHATLLTPDYEIIYGKESAGHWAKVWQPNASLVIEPTNFILSKALGEKSIKDGTFDAMAFTVETVHVILSSKTGGVLRNDSFGLGVPGKHRNDCQWY